MKLNRLILENFRCFRSAEIDLSADVIAIYGRNGTGKTALFDALEFSLTGEIGRFVGESTPPGCLGNAFAPGERTKVRLEFDSVGPSSIEVTIDGQTSDVQCSDNSGSRKDFFFSTLVDDDYLPPRREFGPLVGLFRATILLSQATMCAFIAASEGERSGLISNLVGAAYLQRCLEKARGVIAEGERRLRRNEVEIQEISPKLRESETQIQERDGRLLALNASVHGESITIDQIVASFANLSPGGAVSISLDRDDPNQAVSTLTGFCDEQLAQSRSKLGVLAELKALMPQHSQRLLERDATTGRLELLRETAARGASGERALTERVTTEQAAANEMRIARDSLDHKCNQLSHLAQLLKSRAQIEQSQDAARKKLEALEKERSAAAEKVDTLERSASGAIQKIAISSGEIVAASGRIAILERIHAGVQDYANRQQLIATRRNENQQAGERVNVLSADRQQFQTQESALLRKSEQLARESAEATSESAEIAQAILKLRTHSKDGVCPLCGHPHESEAALQNEIDAKLTAISSVATRLQREARDIEEQRNSVHRKLAAIDDEAARLRHQREEGDRQIESLLQANQALEEQALRANTSLDRGVLESALVSHRSAASAAQTELNETQAKAKITEQSLSEIRAGLGALNERISTDRFTLDQLLLQRAEIDRQIAVSELPTSGLDLIIAQTQGQLVAKRGEYDAKIEAIAALQRDLLAERERVLEIGRNLSAAERTLLELTQAISDMTGRLRSLKLPENTTGEQLSELQEAAIANERETLAFRDLLERFVTQRKRTILEIERDNLRRQHGDLTDAQRRLQDARSQIEAAVAESGKWEAKLAILVKDSVSQRLNQHRIESFRLFQSMIPTPYLFDDITVTQGDGGVRLGLRYRGVAEDVGEPRYFLSSAQANVLALSYFLSFSCRQRWCKLQTILMDDPVQHLDDLDAVALLDVVRALVVSGSKPRRQIIISTCDYNLYALMIRKFSGLPPEQLRFAAISLHDIGTGGPVIRYDYAGTASSRAA